MSEIWTLEKVKKRLMLAPVKTRFNSVSLLSNFKVFFDKYTKSIWSTSIKIPLIGVSEHFLTSFWTIILMGEKPWFLK